MGTAVTKPFTIGIVARRSGVGIETVRFYERKGLIDQPPRQSRKYREYPEDVVAQLQFIRRAKELGFTLSEIKELLLLHRDPATPAADVRHRVEAKVVAIDAKMRSLSRMKDALERMISSCRCHNGAAGCPLLEALSGEEPEEAATPDLPKNVPATRISEMSMTKGKG